MKKRILFLSLMLVLILVTAVPSAALAKGNEKGRPSPAVTDFSGGGLLYVSYMPTPSIHGNIWRFNGEIAEVYGQLQGDWDLLAGAGFWSSHDSVVYVANDGTCRGVMWGTFKIVRPDGELQGFFEGKIRGNLFAYLISDSGSWHSIKGTGVYKNVSAWGKWSAEFNPNTIPGTLAGPMVWEGKYLKK